MLYWYAAQMKQKVGDVGGVIVFSSQNDYRNPDKLGRVKSKFTWLSGPYSSQVTAAKFLGTKVRFTNAPVPVTVIHKGVVTVQHLVDPSRKKLTSRKKNPVYRSVAEELPDRKRRLKHFMEGIENASSKSEKKYYQQEAAKEKRRIRAIEGKKNPYIPSETLEYYRNIRDEDGYEYMEKRVKSGIKNKRAAKQILDQLWKEINQRKNPRITKLTSGEKIDEQLRKLKEELLYKHAQYCKQYGKNPPRAWHEKQLKQLKQSKRLMTEIYAGEPKIDRAIVMQEGAIVQEEKALAQHDQMDQNPPPLEAPKTDLPGPTSPAAREKRGKGRMGYKPGRVKEISKRIKRVTRKGRTTERLAELRKQLTSARSKRIERWKKRKSSTGRKTTRIVTKTRRGLYKPRTQGEKTYQKRADYTKRLAIGRKTGGFGIGRRVGRRTGMMKNPPSLRYVVLEVDHKDLRDCVRERKGPFTHAQAIDALPKLKKLYQAMGFKIHYARVH